MKKLFVLVSLLVLGAACAMQPAGNSNTANTNNGMKSTAAPSEADLMAKEKAAWDAFKKKDADAFNKLLATDYIEVLDSGVMDKAQSSAGMKDFDITDVTFSDWKMIPIDKDAALLTYKANVKGKFKGEDIPPGPYYEASAYVNRNGEWLAIYYQETASQKMEQTPPPPPAKKESSSPAAAPPKPPETGSDPIANEKIVWDLFRAKNWDGFASLLAPEFMEVEAEAVYNKSGSVKSLQENMDASQFDLTEWKAVPFDDDAKLVTYTATMKGAKPEKAYHATIWVRRDGKWLGLYHQGTPAAAPAPAKADEKKTM
jgi:hypothetical protein